MRVAFVLRSTEVQLLVRRFVRVSRKRTCLSPPPLYKSTKGFDQCVPSPPLVRATVSTCTSCGFVVVVVSLTGHGCDDELRFVWVEMVVVRAGSTTLCGFPVWGRCDSILCIQSSWSDLIVMISIYLCLRQLYGTNTWWNFAKTLVL